MFLPDGMTASIYKDENGVVSVLVKDRAGCVLLNRSPNDTHEIGAALQKLAWDAVQATGAAGEGY